MAYQRGHVKGHKQEKKRATAWYRSIEARHIRQVEATWQPQPPPPQREEEAA